MNTGSLKGYPEQPTPGEVLTVDSNGHIIQSGTSSEIAAIVKWGG